MTPAAAGAREGHDTEIEAASFRLLDGALRQLMTVAIEQGTHPA